MCISCGCGEGFDDHGDESNITANRSIDELSEDDLAKAAEAQGITVEEVRNNLKARR
jgi:hypothetical protein